MGFTVLNASTAQDPLDMSAGLDTVLYVPLEYEQGGSIGEFSGIWFLGLTTTTGAYLYLELGPPEIVEGEFSGLQNDGFYTPITSDTPGDQVTQSYKIPIDRQVDSMTYFAPGGRYQWIMTNNSWETSTNPTLGELIGARPIDLLDDEAGLNIAGHDDALWNGQLTGDTLVGTDAGDFIKGLKGDDTIIGGKGNDDLNGGEGNDRLQGGDHLDYLFGGAGIDFLFGEQGDDYLDGGLDGDFLYGQSGNDLFVGGSGGNDEIHGGEDIDEVFYDSEKVAYTFEIPSWQVFGNSEGAYLFRIRQFDFQDEINNDVERIRFKDGYLDINGLRNAKEAGQLVDVTGALLFGGLVVGGLIVGAPLAAILSGTSALSIGSAVLKKFLEVSEDDRPEKGRTVFVEAIVLLADALVSATFTWIGQKVLGKVLTIEEMDDFLSRLLGDQVPAVFQIPSILAREKANAYYDQLFSGHGEPSEQEIINGIKNIVDTTVFVGIEALDSRAEDVYRTKVWDTGIDPDKLVVEEPVDIQPSELTVDLDTSPLDRLDVPPAKPGVKINTLTQLDGLEIIGFGSENTIVVSDAAIPDDQISITYSSAIIEIDQDNDGSPDATITLVGDYEGVAFTSRTDNGQTKIFIDDGSRSVGSSDEENFMGSADADFFDGLGGADEFDAAEGNDTIFGGSGDDIAFGGEGEDIVLGGAGSDSLVGGANDDLLMGDGASFTPTDYHNEDYFWLL